jgi:hypothetical protein
MILSPAMIEASEDERLNSDLIFFVIEVLSILRSHVV